MPAKIKDEPAATYAAQSAAALVNEAPPPVVYLEGRCPRCNLIPVKVQGGTSRVVTCGMCQKVVES